MKTSLVQVVILLTLVLLSTEPMSATTLNPRCELASLRTHFREAKAVFSAEVIKMKSKGNSVEISFKVLKSWKGARMSEIVATANPADPETVDFVKGKRYLVFASQFHGGLFVGGCSGTAELESSRTEIEQLTKWRR